LDPLLLGVRTTQAKLVFLSGVPEGTSSNFRWSIFTKFGHDACIHVLSKMGKDFRKIFSSICPNNIKLEGVKQVPYSDQSAAQWTHYRKTRSVHVVA